VISYKISKNEKISPICKVTAPIPKTPEPLMFSYYLLKNYAVKKEEPVQKAFLFQFIQAAFVPNTMFYTIRNISSRRDSEVFLPIDIPTVIPSLLHFQ